MTTDGLPQQTRIGRTALRVNDIEEMTGFYRDIVGLDVLHHSDTSSVLGVEDTPLLILAREEDERQRHSSAAGLFHNAFRVPSREALGDALARIREHWELSGASDHDVSEALYLTDPEDNGIEIYRDRPREDWPRNGDGSVRMGTYPLDLEALEGAAAGDAGLPAGTDIGHVHLEVSSLEAFQNFYVDTVGFEVQVDDPGAVFVSAGGYHHHIGANTWNQRSQPVSGRGLSWFEVLLPDTEALDGVQARITDSQYPVIETEDDGIAVTGPDEIEVRFRTET
ncbi:VOC family protein [Haloarcula japonica]|uniref:Glyoxalase/bleomycin resistance protein/dioxygenase n=1 Tax=Haloarcula japonica (strain ATCC 49778 / DSM 6131 / JCM 7785 / NBRC 101032 / NCIMB 13157 / TR-1) TaxID=1227453 RepID=M0L902_HALJT|nr:VOC family protein [Haloarcula japonica]EMA28420.1 Glyoxalase/bleomycin resistance protein/dioxygenase [Haloarcula japonica DSM 6131]